MTKAVDVASYLASLNETQRKVVEQMMSAIAETAPGAKQVFSYGIPGFKLDGQPLAWVGAWAKHFSMYPLTEAMREAAGTVLDNYETSKGTIRFPASEPVPLDLVREMVAARVAEIEGGNR